MDVVDVTIVVGMAWWKLVTDGETTISPGAPKMSGFNGETRAVEIEVVVALARPSLDQRSSSLSLSIHTSQSATDESENGDLHFVD